MERYAFIWHLPGPATWQPFYAIRLKVRQPAPICASALDPVNASARSSARPSSHAGALIDLDARTVPFAALNTLAERIGVTLEEILAVAGISARTAARRKAERFLKPEEADRVLRIARVVEESARVFGGYEKAAAWLRARHPLLAGAAPFALLGSDAGAKSVSDKLIRIDHGDFA